MGLYDEWGGSTGFCPGKAILVHGVSDDSAVQPACKVLVLVGPNPNQHTGPRPFYKVNPIIRKISFR